MTALPRISALSTVRRGRLGADVPEPGIRLGERWLGALWQITAWPDRLEQAGAAAARAAGITSAPGPGRAHIEGGAMLMRTEPLRWLLATTADSDPPELQNGDGTLLDLGHARTVIRIEGPEARRLMKRLAPLDFRTGRFDEGTVATSAIHHVPATILARDAGFDVLVYRSFAQSIFEYIAEIAHQFGLEIR